MTVVKLTFAGPNLPDAHLEFSTYFEAEQFVSLIPWMQLMQTDPEFMSIETALIIKDKDKEQ